MLRSRFVVLLAFLLAAPPAVNAAAATPRVQRKVAVYEFVGTEGVLVITGRIRDVDGRGFFGSTSLALDAKGIPQQAYFGHVIDFDDVDTTSPSAYGTPAGDLCAGPDTCEFTRTPDGVTFSYIATVSGFGRPYRTALALFAEGKIESWKVTKAGGWSLSKKGTGLRRITSSQSTAMGVRPGGGLQVEMQQGGTLPGGRKGSVALLFPPCEVTGAGVLTLLGGATQPQAMCPTDLVEAVAHGATTWSYSGAAVGVTYQQTRLVVVDF